jgi:hypothetical protein
MAMTLDGSASVTINNGAVLGITSGTAVASTSGTSIDFNSIPSWVKRLTVMFNEVSTSGTSIVQIQIGDGSVNTTGYSASATLLAVSTMATGTATTGFITSQASNSASALRGSIVLNLVGSNIWVSNGVLAAPANTWAMVSAGNKTLSGTLDRVRITTVNGTDTFDAGSINIMYEG